MSIRPVLAVALIACLAFTGLCLKLDLARGNQVATATSTRVAQALVAQGFDIADQRNLANRGDFVATVVTQEGCPGWLAVMPLPRNAEARDLLQRHVSSDADVTFHLNGTSYADFPEASFWLQQKLHAFERAVLRSENEAPQVLAAAEHGPCNLSNQVRWDTVGSS